MNWKCLNVCWQHPHFILCGGQISSQITEITQIRVYVWNWITCIEIYINFCSDPIWKCWVRTSRCTQVFCCGPTSSSWEEAKPPSSAPSLQNLQGIRSLRHRSKSSFLHIGQNFRPAHPYYIQYVHKLRNFFKSIHPQARITRFGWMPNCWLHGAL